MRHGRQSGLTKTLYRGGYWLWAITCVVLLISLGLLCGAVEAADRTRPWRIGALNASWGPTPPVVGLRDGLLELGYREDEDFVLGVRFTQGNIAALPEAARQLVGYGVDLIFVSVDEAVKAAQQVTTQIPIVFASIADPLGLGVIESFARPGGNVTGVADLERHLGPKRLQVLQELIPTLKRVLFPYDASEAYAVNMARIYAEAAKALDLALMRMPLRSEAEARATLTALRRGEVDGIIMPHSTAFNIIGMLAEVEARQGIPVLHNSVFSVEQGGLASYGPDFYKSGRQAARLVDKIFKGAKPADIPVEVNAQIEFVINLKRASALGLTIPPEVLFQADRLIR